MFFILGIITGILIAVISIFVGIALSKQTKFRNILDKVEQSTKPRGMICEKEDKIQKAKKAFNQFLNIK